VAARRKALSVIGITLLLGVLAIPLLVILMAGGLQSPRRTSVPPETLSEVPPPSGAPPEVLTVVSWNIAWGYGWGSEGSGKARPRDHFDASIAQMGAVLKSVGADLVLLQEVDFGSRRSHHQDQARLLAQAAGLPHLARAESWTAPWVPFPYWPPSEQFGTMHSGGAILSRFPIERHEVELLEKPAENPAWYNLFYLFRYLESAEVRIGDRTLKVLNTHLEAFKQDNRVLQAKLTRARLEAAMGPYVIYGGDLNSVPPEAPYKKGYPDEPETNHESDPTISLFRDLPGLIDTIGSSTISARPEDFYTFPAHAPNRKLDHLFVGTGFEIVEARVLKEAGPHSDHLPLLLRVRFRPAQD
jgi:endonuclease/exonuclease/phosphatase family metal-dependent hydrolase